MKKISSIFLATLIALGTTGGIFAQETKQALPERKQTTLGLYVTAKEAYDMWKANPDKVKVLDVRTVIEYIWVGHPEMALNIPAFHQTTKWDEEKQYFALEPDPNFIPQVQKHFAKNDIILAFCRSGDRSATAVNMLAKAGFTNVYTITDGFEGDLVTDPDNVFYGTRMKNGWKNSGNPYTYKVDPKQVIVPDLK